MENQQPVRNTVSNLHSLPQKAERLVAIAAHPVGSLSQASQSTKVWSLKYLTKEYAPEPHSTPNKKM